MMQKDKKYDDVYLYIHNSRDIVFKWGQNDCVLWVHRFIKKYHKVDYLRSVKAQYQDENGAMELIRKLGCDTLKDLSDRVLNRKKMELAMRGDIMMWKGALGICNGLQSHFLLEKGITSIKTQSCDYCWEVP